MIQHLIRCNIHLRAKSKSELPCATTHVGEKCSNTVQGGCGRDPFEEIKGGMGEAQQEQKQSGKDSLNRSSW